MSRGFRVGWTPTTRRGFTLFWATLFALSLLLQYASLAAPAEVAANSTGNQLVGGFEIDGDLYSGTMNPPGYDWAQGTTGTGLLTAPTFIDPIGTADTTNFGQGSKENQSPSQWTGATGTAPDKTDMGNIYVYAEVQPFPAQPDSHLWTYLAVERASANGTTFYDFEFNQNPNVTNPQGISVPNRSVGDILVVAQQQGSGIWSVSATVQSWTGSAWSSALTPPAGTFYGLSNDRSIPQGPWTDAIAKNGQVGPGQFAEMAIDLSAIAPLVGAGSALTCPSTGYAAVNVRSRASDAVNAELKDYAGGPVKVPSNCAKLIINKQDSHGAPLGGAAFSITPNPITGSSTPLVVTDNQTPDANPAAGVIEIDDARPNVAYAVTEITPPTGYLLPTPASQTTSRVLPFGTATLTFVDPKASLSLTKSASPTVIHAGDQVQYTYTVTNTGEVTISGIAITDDKIASGITCSATTLTPGQSTTCDVSTGISVDTVNIATAAGTAQGQTITSNPATATVHVIHPALSLTKTGSALAVESGATVTYTYHVTNTGDDPISNLAISDDRLTGVTCASTTLAVGASTDCTAGTTISEDTTNTATASGHDSLGGDVKSNTATWTVVILVPGLNITKVADPTVIEVNGQVTYTYHVTNTGHVQIHDLTIVDNRLASSAITCGQTDLSTGESTDCTATTSLAATTTNVAHATGITPDNNDVSSGTATATVRVIHPALTLEKVASAHLVAPGTPVIYTYHVTNTGDSPISNLAVADDQLSSVTCISTSLPVGASTDCTAGTTISTTTTNIATASGLDELGHSVSSGPASQTVTVISPSLALTKTGSTTNVVGSGPVTYTYHVTNTTVVPEGVDTSAGTITGIHLNDNVLGSISCPDADLAAGASMDCTAGTTITQDTTNTAQASGVDFFGSTVNSNQAQWTVTVTPPPAHLTLIKIVSGGTATAADWTVSASAGSTVVLSGAGGASGDLPAGDYVLAESGSTQNYIASAWGCDGGSLEVSTGTVSLSAGQTATCSITNTYVAPGTPHVTITKLVNASSAITITGGASTGLTYTIEVKNIGDATTATDYAVLDNAFPSFYSISSVTWTKNGGTTNTSSASTLTGTSGIDVGRLNPGDDVIVSVVGTAAPAAANAGPFTNTAKACPVVEEVTSTDGCLQGTASVTVTFTPPPPLTCEQLGNCPTSAPTPTPSPTGSVAGITSPPKPTLPPTDTLGRTGSSTPGSNFGLLLVLLAGLMTALGLLTPVPVKNRRDRRG